MSLEKYHGFMDSADTFVESDIYLNAKMIVLGVFFIIIVGYIVAKLIWRKR